jgi:putative tryptophan/tyrosine transport system substrate-binding protein
VGAGYVPFAVGSKVGTGRPVIEGMKPADLPVERPARSNLVIRLKAAKALRLDLPPMLFVINAAEVIE